MGSMPLDGFNVIDLSNGLAGPTATALLADFGADVVTIEPPDGGSQRKIGGGGIFPNVSRNKESVAIDLKSNEGKSIFHDLVSEADALLHNTPPGRMEAFGCDYVTVSELNPEIVYCSITGFGESGIYRDRPGIDSIGQAMSGLMWATGEPDRKPSRVGGGAIDVATGFIAAFSVVTGLFNAHRYGEGDKIEATLLDTAAAIMGGSYTSYSKTGEQQQRNGDGTSKYAPCGVFNTKTDPLYIAVPFQYMWEKLCDAVDRPDWNRESRFESNEARLANEGALDREIEEEFSNYRREELLEMLLNEFITASELKTVADAAHDDHLHDRGTIETVEDVDGTEVVATTTPVHFTRLDPGIGIITPEIGAHTKSVLREMGYTDDEIADLVKSEVVEIN